MFDCFSQRATFLIRIFHRNQKPRTATIDFPTNRRSDLVNCNSVNVRIDNEPLKGLSHQMGLAQKWYSMVQKALGEHRR
jgi:hypothetical protein